jgi:hypothetical protein
LLASEVKYENLAGQMVVEGNIIRLSTSNGSTVMDLILQQGPPGSNMLPMGRRVSVTVPSSGVTYSVDDGTFTLPNGLSFASITDLVVGQEVSVAVQAPVAASSGSANPTSWVGGGGLTFTTNSITLEPSQITGSVAAVNTGQLSFTLSSLPNFFVPPAATAGSLPILVPINITVQTTAATTFTNFNPESIMGLAVNDVVSVGGWVFSTPSGATAITLAAESVVDRPGPTPLF